LRTSLLVTGARGAGNRRLNDGHKKQNRNNNMIFQFTNHVMFSIKISKICTLVLATTIP